MFYLAWMDRLEFYKEQYFKEHERHNQINDSLSLPIGVMTGIVAAAFYFTTSFDYGFNAPSTIVFGVSILAIFVLLVFSIFYVIKAYANLHRGYGYSYLADAKDLDTFYCGLREHYLETSGVAEKSDNEFKDYLLKELIANTDANQKSNKQKSFYRHMANRCLVLAMPFLLLSLFPFAYNYALAQKPNEQFNIQMVVPPQAVSIRFDDTIPDTIQGTVVQFADSNKVQKPTPPQSQQVK